jgi:hypothetical protein
MRLATIAYIHPPDDDARITVSLYMAERKKEKKAYGLDLFNIMNQVNVLVRAACDRLCIERDTSLRVEMGKWAFMIHCGIGTRMQIVYNL